MMRIDELQLSNFKKFEAQTFRFSPYFTLLIGENGSGKTSVLDALAVSLGIWLVNIPDSTLTNSRRNIWPSERYLVAENKGDRTLFQEKYPVLVKATGQIAASENVTWTRQIRDAGSKTTNTEAKEALDIIKRVYALDQIGQSVLCPVIVYYGAGRAWLPSNEQKKSADTAKPARRWEAFYDCFNERIRFPNLNTWFMNEAIEKGNLGRTRPGFEVVSQAVKNCVPDADKIWYDSDRKQIAFSIKGKIQPFDNLSAGQRMMLAMVADIAIKAVTQNSHLLPANVFDPEKVVPAFLAQTPGVVLIDELDVHLHPRWQRRIITDLRRTFPAIQFIATSHSPFIIQSLRNGKLIDLDHEQPREYEDKSIEDIAENVMGVEVPQKSKRYLDMMAAAEAYFRLLQQPDHLKDALDVLDQKLNELAMPYSDDPAYQALLKVEREIKRKRK